jgi:hypothetical protein
MSRARSILYRLAAIALILLSTSVAGGDCAQAQARLPSIEERQRSLRTISREKPAARQPPEEQLAHLKIEEDFKLLQVLNNYLSEAVVSASALNYRQVKRDASEIRKCVARLKVNLSLPEAEKDEKAKKSEELFLIPQELPLAIKMLDAVVKSFVLNPIFQQPGVLDVEYSAAARRDLERIGSLSEQIRRRAESLGKAKKP